MAEVADTPVARERGLSGRHDMASNHAMLFSFDTNSNECFWMRDMLFNIDIVWLDGQNKVTAIERNISPSSYPQNFCHDGQHVIEFTAGTIDRLHLKVGDQADL